jgi:hypothetical protein
VFSLDGRRIGFIEWLVLVGDTLIAEGGLEPMPNGSNQKFIGTP